MAGIEEKLPMAGDWAPMNSNTQDISSSFIGEGAPPEEKVPTVLPEAGEEDGGRGRSTPCEPFSEVKPPTGPRFGARAGLAERMAVRAGFNAPKLNTDRIRSGDVPSFSSEVQSPYLTIPPGLSPTSFLDSPVFVSNSLAQPSPTTGKFALEQLSNNCGSSTDKSRYSSAADVASESFVFKPLGELSSYISNAKNNIASSMDHQHLELSSKLSVPTGSPNLESADAAGITHPQDLLHFRSEQKDSAGDLSDSLMGDEPVDFQQDGEAENRGESPLVAASVQSEDGYNWRKYGQKQVKGSEYPRSYYKCTHPNCQVKKKVERSLEGVTTEITYKGTHNHPKPTAQGRRSGAVPSLHPFGEGLADGPEARAPPPVSEEHGQGPEGLLFESAGGSDLPSNLSNEEEDDDRVGGVEEDELESKRRKLDVSSMEAGASSRAVREPRVVVQTTSEVDILDDGYRWRKYGQKVVKGNPNPRSYYKCTNPGCTVRKHVERASHDLKSVITTYEGKHNHDVPVARSNSHTGTGPSGGGGAAPPPVHRRPMPGLVAHDGLPSFDGPSLPPLGSFAPAGFPIVGQPTLWALQHGNGWPGAYRQREDAAAATGGPFGGGAAPLEGGWLRDTQG